MSGPIIELEALIDKLSTDIKEVLKQMQRNKTAAQQRLNDIRDPVTRLPHEIASQIFIHSFPSHLQPGAPDSPMLLLRIGNSWTDIALSTPELWCSILDYPGVQILNTWLEHARNQALSASLRRALCYDAATSMGQFTERLKHLEIYEENRNLALGSLLFPLKIGCLLDENGNSSIGQTMTLLSRLSPHLVDCTFHRVSSYRAHDVDLEALVLPGVYRLKLGESKDSQRSDIPPFGVLPALETLFVPLDTILHGVFPAFLKRPLRKLVIGDGPFGPTLAELAECLRLTPSINHLELHIGRIPLLNELFTALASSKVLPHLRTLTVVYYAPFDGSSYPTILRMLSSRRGQLAHFELRPSSKEVPISTPQGAVQVKLRQLIAGGMKIHIGGVHNLVWF